MSRLVLRALPLVTAAALLAGCAAPNSGSTQSTLMNMVMFQSSSPPPPDQLPKDQDLIVCPFVTVVDSGAALRSYAGQTGDAQALRNQLSINEVARECTNGDLNGSFTLKVGVQGRVLIGPAGSPGTYQANLRTVVKRGSTVVANRIARVGGTIAGGQSGVDFVHVEQGIPVPPGSGEVSVEVGLEGGGAVRPAARRR